MQHEQQVYMQHVQPINVLKKHVKKHVKPTSSSIVKVPTGKRVMQHDDDDLNKRIPAESTEQQPKISVSSGEFDFEQNQVAARPDLFESSIVIRPNHSSGDGGHDSALVAKWCERLSQGFHWIKNRDGAAYESVVHVRLEHILLGLCYSVARARGHKFSAFSYAVPAILEEYSNSVRYGTEAEELTGLAAHHVAITLTALKSGKWSANDYDEPEWANFKVETRELARTVLALTR
jgi:hypothetical protein